MLLIAEYLSPVLFKLATFLQHLTRWTQTNKQLHLQGSFKPYRLYKGSRARINSGNVSLYSIQEGLFPF